MQNKRRTWRPTSATRSRLQGDPDCTKSCQKECPRLEVLWLTSSGSPQPLTVEELIEIHDIGLSYGEGRQGILYEQSLHYAVERLFLVLYDQEQSPGPFRKVAVLMEAINPAPSFYGRQQEDRLFGGDHVTGTSYRLNGRGGQGGAGKRLPCSGSNGQPLCA